MCRFLGIFIVTQIYFHAVQDLARLSATFGFENRMIYFLTQEDEVQQKKKSERARRFLEEKKRRDEELKTKFEKVCSSHFKHTLLKA